ncbi:MAG TPA: SPOR domain-containing protein [Candidatus Xenobia bacterium]|nr:SPOR domain-containing protein [Candidatus Xenobia bacterium]
MNSPREPRIPMQLRVEIHGTDWEGKPYQENAFTANISRTGTRLSRAAALRHPGERVELRRGKEKAPYSVVWIGAPGSPVAGQVGMRLLDPVKNIWGVPLPPPVLVSSEEEWKELSAGLPPIPAINEAEETPATPEAVSAVATEEAEAEEESGFTGFTATPPAPPESAAPAPETRSSDSLEAAFTRLQSDAPPAEAEQGAVTEELAVTEEPAPVYTEPAQIAFDADDNQAAPAEFPEPSVPPDTVTYGPQFLPEPSTPAARPFYTRPVIYLGLGAALVLLLILNWSRTRTVPASPQGESPVAASTAEPAAPPPVPVQEAQPAPTQPAPAQPAQTMQIEAVLPEPQAAARTEPAAVGTFAVQVGAYESAETAQALATSLGARYDCKGVVDTVQAGGKTLHRVRLIAGTQADAQALAARVRRERASDAIVVRQE